MSVNIYVYILKHTQMSICSSVWVYAARVPVPEEVRSGHWIPPALYRSSHKNTTFKKVQGSQHWGGKGSLVYTVGSRPSKVTCWESVSKNQRETKKTRKKETKESEKTPWVKVLPVQAWGLKFNLQIRCARRRNHPLTSIHVPWDQRACPPQSQY